MKKFNPDNVGMGRLKSADDRDKNFPLKAILPKKVSLTSKYWDDRGWWGDQGNLNECVGYSLAHWLENSPITHKAAPPVVAPHLIYSTAQTMDEWDGEEYEGTSVRGGAKALQSMGFISSYVWAFDLATMIDAVLTKGPVVVGTNWYESMFYPTNGLIKVSGDPAGGHAYLINGVNTSNKLFRIKNSWGQTWGIKGRAFISFADMERLIHEDGEVMLGVEVNKD
jgi:hypothetical protein